LRTHDPRTLVKIALFRRGLLTVALALLLLSLAWSSVVILVTYSSTFSSAKASFDHYYSAITCTFHFLAVLSFLFYLVVFVKMHTSTSIIVLHTMLSSHFMKAEKINLLQGFIILIAYTSSAVIDFTDGSIVDWDEYPAYLVREIAEGVTGLAIPIMIFVCSYHFRTDAAKLFVFWRR
ncbi:hypothetical protein OESDEN_04924, partial [Oesophagostomum dentatum]